MSYNTPLESFINYKADTKKQCGSYKIDLPKLGENEQYRFHFDMSICVGCHCCEVACNEQNNNPANIKWRRVAEMEAGVFPKVNQLFNSMSCNHCIEPECLRGCPTNSYTKIDNGIVLHNDNSCIGCQYCTWNCPYEVPIFNKDRAVVTKCNMCYEKLEVNQTPACVQACPVGAIQIEVVDKDIWIKNEIYSKGQAPHLPDVEITKPTTRYTLPSFEGKVKAMDEHILKPAHSELPLVFMTVLTQLSLGGFFALFLGELTKIFGLNLASPNFILIISILIPAVLGLMLSALHLGRPLFALNAMKNIKTSWLSREAVALAIYTAGLSFISFMYYIKVESYILILVEIFILLFGIYGIYAQSMIYRVKARPAWNKSSTTYRFFGSGYIGFLLVAFMMLDVTTDRSVMIILTLALLFGFLQINFIYQEINFYKYLSKDNPYYYQLNRTKTLLEKNFSNLKNLRIISLIIFALIIPIVAVVLTASFEFEIASLVLAIGLFGALFSELLGRYLFFVTVVPLGLAGNFFMGRQR